MSNPYIGQIQMFGFNFPPRGWAFCDGQLLPISSNTALFSLLGTTFGGDGRTTFGLPDLRGRDAVHVGSGPGLSPVSWGQKSGANNVTLSAGNLPSHTHTLRASDQAADATTPTGNVFGVAEDADRNPLSLYQTGAANQDMDATAIQNTGSNQSFSVQNPFTGIYHSIALTGIFPSRN